MIREEKNRADSSSQEFAGPAEIWPFAIKSN